MYFQLASRQSLDTVGALPTCRGSHIRARPNLQRKALSTWQNMVEIPSSCALSAYLQRPTFQFMFKSIRNGSSKPTEGVWGKPCKSACGMFLLAGLTNKVSASRKNWARFRNKNLTSYHRGLLCLRNGNINKGSKNQKTKVTPFRDYCGTNWSFVIAESW